MSSVLFWQYMLFLCIHNNNSANYDAFPSSRVHSMKATQVDVRYHLMKGRIHATLCENVEKDCDDVIMTSPRKRGMSVLRGVKVGDQLQARVVRIKARQVEGWVAF